MAKRKLRPDRILILVLFIILIILLIVLGFKTIFQNAFNSKEQQEEVVPQEIAKVEGTRIEKLEYEVYKKDEDLGFGFVVAKLRFIADEAINYDLANLKTDEDIYLNDTLGYEKKLKTSGYDFKNLNTSLDVYSDKKELTLNLFIPYINERESLTLTDIKSNASLNFDLNSNVIDMNVLKPEEKKQEDIKTTSYEFKCDVPRIEDMMKHNGEPFDSSMLSVYAFKLTCLSIEDGITIKNAVFIDSNGNETEAYDSSYSGKTQNILDKTLKVGDTYALFFQLYSNSEDKVVYEGKIRLEFSDGSLAEVETVMN